MTLLWRLDELVRHSQQVLALLATDGGESRRVRWRPDARLVRYYTTLGLLDRPAEMRGRTAYYRDRHLLQLLAIKALQARSLSLQTIQQELAGQSDAALRQRLGLPEDWATCLETSAAISHPTPSPTPSAAPTTTTRFWEQRPAPPALAPNLAPSTAALTEIPGIGLLAIPLAPGAQLLLERRRYPQLDSQLKTALAALRLALLAARTPESAADGGEAE